MARRKIEPDEALGPPVDGLAEPVRPPLAEDLPLPDMPEPVEEIQPEPEQRPRLLIFGDGAEAEAVATLAVANGFFVEAVSLEESERPPADDPAIQNIILPGFENLVAGCGIERDCHICVFLEEPDLCEQVMRQVLASEASYIGMAANPAQKAEIFGLLKADGVPDAELAAVCCPIGLNIGAVTPGQRAVSVVAELLAARAGTLKRLRSEE